MGLGLTMVLMQFILICRWLCLTPVYGFHGGHGTANAAGAALMQAGWADGLAVSNTMRLLD